MFIKKVYIVFLFPLLLSSCEKEIPYDITNFEKKLAVDAIVENGVAKLFISQNSSTFSSDTIISLKNADVFINGIKIDENGQPEYPYIKILNNIKPGDVLNLSVSYNDLPDITAQAVIPQKPGFKILSSKIVQGKELLWYDEYLEFCIELEENRVNTPDYYIVELINGIYMYDYVYNDTTQTFDKKYNKTYKSHSVFYTKDNVAEIIGRGLSFELNKDEFTLADDPAFPEAFVISDKTFDGKTKTLTFITNRALVDLYEFRVTAINEGYYEFIQSVAAYNFNSGIFNEPIRIKSNINGGFGYFGIKTTVADSIKISDIN